MKKIVTVLALSMAFAACSSAKKDDVKPAEAAPAPAVTEPAPAPAPVKATKHGKKKKGSKKVSTDTNNK